MDDDLMEVLEVEDAVKVLTNYLNSSTMDETPGQRKRRLARERKKRWKANLTGEKLEQIRREDAERHRLRYIVAAQALSGIHISIEALEAKRLADAQRQRLFRATQTPLDREARLRKDAAAHAVRRLRKQMQPVTSGHFSEPEGRSVCCNGNLPNTEKFLINDAVPDVLIGIQESKASTASSDCFVNQTQSNCSNEIPVHTEVNIKLKDATADVLRRIRESEEITASSYFTEDQSRSPCTNDNLRHLLKDVDTKVLRKNRESEEESHSNTNEISRKKVDNLLNEGTADCLRGVQYRKESTVLSYSNEVQTHSNYSDESLQYIEESLQNDDPVLRWILESEESKASEYVTEVQEEISDGSDVTNYHQLLYNNFSVEGKEASSDDEIYVCDFDISEVVNQTLKNLDVKLQIQDAISATSNTIDVLAMKYQATHDVFSGLEEQIKKLDLFTRQKILQGAPRRNVQSNVPKTVPLHVYPGKTTSDPSADVIPLVKINVSKPAQMPPAGIVVRKELDVSTRVYAMKGSMYGAWFRAKVVEIKEAPNKEKLYKIRYENRKQVNHNISGKHLAYAEPSKVLLPVGTRVIAKYKDEYFNQPNSMYAGIIAEPLKVMNKYRYLIFFDDGCAQYVEHADVRLVCNVSREVWEDVHPDSREFIKSYLNQYPERPMVKLQTNHNLKTEWNGKWWVAKVMEVDGSLVKMYFHADKRTEWIYRGSTRLGPLYSELANAEAVRLSGKGARRHNLVLTNKRSAPYVEYTRGLDEPIHNFEDVSIIDDDEDADKKQVARKHTKQNVARKSTSSAASPAKAVPASPNLLNIESAGSFETITLDSTDERKHYVQHQCNESCLKNIDDDPVKHKGKSQLTIPMLYSWERQICKHKSISKRVVMYRAPCGRRLRSLEEIYKYLVLTKSKLTIDLFCMDSYVHCIGEFVPSRIFAYIKDISYGKENVPVSGVNSLNREYPDYLEYSTKRIPNKGVNLNLDPDFLVCCSCEGNCDDRSKCECQQLTVKATGTTPGSQMDPNAGYYFRRLPEQLITGVYECNERCKCSSRCLNRVAQNGLTLRLQVFKTVRRGWGIRCLDDIPQGGFICIYAGQLLTEQGANEDGTQFGDEYLAELDYIEVVERMKEGYESDVIEPDTDDDEDSGPGNVRKQKGNRNRSVDDIGDRPKSDASYSSGDEKEPCSSDSDFETRSRPSSPRVYTTRHKDKVHKLILRREASDQESNQSWSVRHGQTGEGTEESTDDASSVTTTATLENASKNSRDGDTKEKSSKSKLETVDSGNKKKPTSPIAITILSDSDEENPKKGKTSKEDKSKYGPVADPVKKDGSNKSKLTGLTSEPGKRVKYQSVRSLYGDEFCYIMDAKSLGNIGRYLNHSCSPNTFVQNVFVDTHDLRFPWVAFFALHYIRAGTELTWDYNYEVGSVPNKVMYCYCGASECRGRLL